MFVASRLLFLSTASSATAGDFIKDLVEGRVSNNGQNVVDILAPKLDALLSLILAGTPLAREAMSEMLKFGFNVLCFYPRVLLPLFSTPSSYSRTPVGYWRPRIKRRLGQYRYAGRVAAQTRRVCFPSSHWGPFSSCARRVLPSLLRTFNSLPPTSPSPITPPMTQVIHNLIMIPVSGPLHQKWFPKSTPHSSKPSSTTSSPASKGSPTLSPTSTSDPLPKEVKTGKIDRALSMLSARSRPSRSPSPTPFSPPDTLLHAYDILEVTLAYYLPEALEPDDTSVREKCKNEDTTLDELVTPLVLLLTRLCIGDEASRARLRDWLIPPNLDRTSPLEGRSDTLGRCLRLLGSVYHTNLKKGIGEMLYAMCDSDGKHESGRGTSLPTLTYWMNSFYPCISSGLRERRWLFIQ